VKRRCVACGKRREAYRLVKLVPRKRCLVIHRPHRTVGGSVRITGWVRWWRLFRCRPCYDRLIDSVIGGWPKSDRAFRGDG
jgi:hypothetical protein